MRAAPLIIFILLVASAQAQYTSKGTINGIEVAYRWKYPMGKPSELHLKLKNTTAEDRKVDLAIDLYYQGRTVETFEADTCIRAGQTLNGRLNGIYFIPERLTTEQLKDGNADVEVTRTLIEAGKCP